MTRTRMGVLALLAGLCGCGGGGGTGTHTPIECQDAAEPKLIHHETLVADTMTECVYTDSSHTVGLTFQHGATRIGYSMAVVRIAGLTGPRKYDTDGLNADLTSVDFLSDELSTGESHCHGQSWVDTSCSGNRQY